MEEIRWAQTGKPTSRVLLSAPTRVAVWLFGMTRDEFEALLARDEADILDILKTTTEDLSDKDALIMMWMQVQMLSRFCYWTADLMAAFLGGWESEAAEEPEKERYDA